MAPPNQTGRQSYNVINLSVTHVHPCVKYQTCEHKSLKTNELILILTGTSGPTGNSMKHQVWQSEGQRSRSHKAEIDHKNPFQWDISRSIQQILTKLANTYYSKCPKCVIITRMQHQGHTRSKKDLEAWQKHHSQCALVGVAFIVY